MAEVGSTIIWTFYGPRLLRIMRRGEIAGYNYQPNFLESFSDRIFHAIKAAFSATYWCSPIVVVMMYRRGYFNIEGVQGLSKMALSVFAVYALAFFFRGIGRLSNADYRNFMGAFVQAKNNPCLRTRMSDEEENDGQTPQPTPKTGGPNAVQKQDWHPDLALCSEHSSDSETPETPSPSLSNDCRCRS
ncbi:hypothetical protein RRG08_041283 [Elysia crispata]|uniref:Phosphatidylserine Lipase ABHD16 N-terminal domain-containing protein n=1 Tax=Elysia crispata TaxID=231223 RepID=A0AAE1D0R6_9GAST|nr:hypothetical protein RRG08_041283 [Elysia crispata]